MFTAAAIAAAATGDQDVHACCDRTAVRAAAALPAGRRRSATAVRSPDPPDDFDTASWTSCTHATATCTGCTSSTTPRWSPPPSPTPTATSPAPSRRRVRRLGHRLRRRHRRRVAGAARRRPRRRPRALGGPAAQPAGHLRRGSTASASTPGRPAGLTRRWPTGRHPRTGRRPGPGPEQPLPARRDVTAASAPPPPLARAPPRASTPRPRVPLRRRPGPHDRAPPLHVRVLDLATLFAGPLAATMLGDFGAEVVKVEHPAQPDPSAATAPPRTAWACGGNSSAATSAPSP